jgi:DNA-binding NarL/FixJ family response regulator
MIVCIDDEPWQFRYYMEELRKVFGASEVILRDSLDDAQMELQNSASKVKAIIQDIMMPAKQGWNENVVEGGLKSGIYFLQENAELLKQYKIPVVFLTNRDVNKIDATINDLKPSLHAVQIYQKTQTPAWMLPSIVQKLIKY